MVTGAAVMREETTDVPVILREDRGVLQGNLSIFASEFHGSLVYQ